MNTRSESPSAMLLVERQMLLSRMRGQGSESRATGETCTPHRFITIARDVGAHGDAVAAELAGRLGWHLFDREIVDFIAQDSHVRQDLVRGLDERSQSLIHDTVQRLLLMAEGISFGNEEYHEALLKTLAFAAARGKAVIVGRGGAYALHGEPGLHVRIVASPEMRVCRLSDRWRVTAEEARKRMHQVDAQRRSFVFHHFRRDLDDPAHYDMICNTDRLTVGQAVHAVLGLMSAPAAGRTAAGPLRFDAVPIAVPDEHRDARGSPALPTPP